MQFTGTPTSGAINLPVTFNSGTSDALADIPLTYLWTFGDGNATGNNVANPVHLYTTIGTYDVSLRITNASGPNTTTALGYIRTQLVTTDTTGLPAGSTYNSSSNNLIVNLSGAGVVQASATAITLNNIGGFSQIIFSGSFTNTSGNLTGSVTGVEYITPAMNANLAGGQAYLTADTHASCYNTSGSIAFTIRSSTTTDDANFNAAVGGRRNETFMVFDIATTNMNCISGSTFNITVPDAFRTRNGDRISVAWNHGGANTQLTATYVTTSGGNAIYSVTVPGGFSTFGLVGLSAAPTPPPSPQFTATPTTGQAPLTVSFTDLSLNTPTGWAWFFGDEDYTAAWTQVTGSAGWTGRASHSSVVMPDGSIVLMGGATNGGYKNDTWRSTDNGVTWTQQNASGGWTPRHGLTSVAMPDGSIVLMGGYDSDGLSKRDVWRSTDYGATWTQQTAAAGWSGRGYTASVVMPDGSIVLMGGGLFGNNDTWNSMDYGATWTQVTAHAGWSARQRHTAMAMPDGSIVLTGGKPSGGYPQNDTWRSIDNGATWTQVTGSAGWTARSGHSSVAMPYGHIVLMGGYVEGDLPQTNDTWRSTDNGATWTQMTGSSGWIERSDHSSVAMPDGSIVLTGGSADGIAKNDVWRLMPAGSSAQNPSHTYTTLGIYSVALQAYNAGGYNSMRKVSYINVIPGVPPQPPSQPNEGNGNSGDNGEPAPASQPAPEPQQPPAPPPQQQPAPEPQQPPEPLAPLTLAEQPVEGLSGVTVSESYPVGFEGLSFNTDGQNSVSLDISAAEQAGATVTTYFDRVEVYQHGSPGVRITFFFDNYNQTSKVISGTAKGAEFETDPLTINVSAGKVAGSVHAVLNSINQPVKVENTITGNVTVSNSEQFRNILAQNNQSVTGFAYIMNFQRGKLTSTGAANVTLTVPPSWVDQHGGKDAVRIARISDSTGTTELINTVYTGADSGGNLVFRGDSPHGTSIFGLLTAKATAAKQIEEPNVTIQPLQKPAVMTEIGMFAWLLGIVQHNPVVIVVIIAVIGVVLYISWKKRQV